MVVGIILHAKKPLASYRASGVYILKEIINN